MKHLSPIDVRAFAAGLVDTDEAERLATHVDECDSCANRVAMADPLSRAFARVPDPPVPVDLAAQVLAAANESVGQAPTVELVVASILLGFAVTTALAGDLSRVVVDTAATLSSFTHLVGALPSLFFASTPLLASTALILATTAVILQRTSATLHIPSERLP